jgi:hypothetical protein
MVLFSIEVKTFSVRRVQRGGKKNKLRSRPADPLLYFSRHPGPVLEGVQWQSRGFWKYWRVIVALYRNDRLKT